VYSPIDSLQVLPADPVLRLAEIIRLLLGEGLSGDRVVRVRGSEIPDRLVGGDKISPLGGAGRTRRESEKGNNQANNRSNGVPCIYHHSEVRRRCTISPFSFSNLNGECGAVRDQDPAALGSSSNLRNVRPSASVYLLL